MHISINTDEPLSVVDKQILSVLAGNEVAVATPAPAPAQAVSKAAPAAKANVSKPAPAKPEPVAEEPAEAPAEESAEAPAEDVKEKAIALATEMVGGGESAKVKKALEAVGAKRVKEIPEDSYAAFYDALTA